MKKKKKVKEEKKVILPLMRSLSLSTHYNRPVLCGNLGKHYNLNFKMICINVTFLFSTLSWVHGHHHWDGGDAKGTHG